VPALTGTASVIVLGEPLTASIVGGLGLTIAGLALSNRSHEKKRVPKDLLSEQTCITET
jgi:drug/metabolite transporter (DMT)-like permease